MTRRPPPRHRLRHRTRRRRAIDSLLVTAAVLGLASVMAAGNAMAPRPRVETVPDLPVAAGHTDTRVSRYEREALLTATVTSAVVELATTAPTRACRCAPRQPVATVPTPTAQNTPQNATSVAVPRESPTAGVRTTPERETGVPSLTESSAPASTTPVATTTAPETTEATSAPDTSGSETTMTTVAATTDLALPDGTEPTATVTEEAP